MRVLLRGAQYNGKARFDTWLFTIARNLVIDLSRKRQMASLDEMSEAGEDERPFEVAIDGPSPLEQFASREDRAEVAEVLLKLEANYREVLVLRFHEEMSLEEIASVTRAPLSTVKSRLYRGLAALKPEVESLRLAHAGGERRPMIEAGKMEAGDMEATRNDAMHATSDYRSAAASAAAVNRTHRVIRERRPHPAGTPQDRARALHSHGRQRVSACVRGLRHLDRARRIRHRPHRHAGCQPADFRPAHVVPAYLARRTRHRAFPPVQRRHRKPG